MRAIEAWSEKITDRELTDQSINDLCFRPDGLQLIVAAGNRVLVYDAIEGNLIEVLKGHKETVYCVKFAKDSKRFASGGADKTVIIWTAELEGILKFTHNDAIQALAFNPVNHTLLTCAITDFGIWSNDQKSVPKIKVMQRITCCSWTHDGQFMALGYFTGLIQIRDKNGNEKTKIERPDPLNSPIWSIEWSPYREEGDVLAVCDWNQRLSFYYLNGKQAAKERKLGFDPTQVNWFSKGEYMLISGADRQCGLYTKEGVKLGTVAEKDSWILCAKNKPDSNFVAVGCLDGTLVMYQLVFGTVHGLYKERYAYRDNMTDVIIQNLVTDVKVRIKCRDLVKKLAVYKSRLAVQLTDKIVIYEIESNDPKDMHYKVKEKILKKFDCNLFVITGTNIVLCQEKLLQCLNIFGEKVREWLMESPVRYIKVIGGPYGKEGILVGLKTGQIFQIFVDSPFPVLLVKLSNAVRCLDMSANRMKLAAVDENQTLYVYNVMTGELIHQEPKANSVAWNSYYDNMLAYSGDGTLSIVASNATTHKQRLQGFVVGYSGSNIFCLNVYTITSIEIPQAESMLQYLENKSFRDAFEVACLGVTTKDWEALAVACLENREIELAKKAAIRSRDFKYLNLISIFEDLQKQGSMKQDVVMAYINAYQGKFTDAAKFFKRANEDHLAMAMYSDLRMFDHAKEHITGGDMDKTNLLLQQAEWANRNSEPRVAAELYISAKNYAKAIEFAGRYGWADMLLDIVRKLDKADRDLLNKCADYLKQMNQFNFAAEVYEKMGNINGLLELRMEFRQWEDVFALAKKYPHLHNQAYYGHAQWLAENDRFEEAEAAFNKAGFKKEAIKVLEQLTMNAVNEERFDDAGYYFYLLSIQYLQIMGDEENADLKLKQFAKFQKYKQWAEIYYTYNNIHRFVNNPFTDTLPINLFQMAKFLIHAISKERVLPLGISKFKLLYTAAKMAYKELEAYKFARTILQKIDELKIPFKFSDEVETLSMNIKAKQFKDDDELMPLCYRCSHHNPLLNQSGNNCSNCGQPYVFCFSSFEVLPLVEFQLPQDINDEDALELLDHMPVNNQLNPNDKNARNRNKLLQNSVMFNKPGTNRLVIGDVPSHEQTDPFVTLMNKYSANSTDFHPVIVTREVLRAMDPTQVFIIKWPKPLRWKWYKIISTEEPITKCDFCNKFFHTDDYEMSVLKNGHCSFCRKSAALK